MCPQAEFGFPFWSSDEREIRAWRLSREHAQMRRMSEEQRKGTPGATDGKRKNKTSLDEGHVVQQCLERSAASAGTLEASRANSPAMDGTTLAARANSPAMDGPTLAAAVVDVDTVSRPRTQTGPNPSAASPPSHIWSSRFRSSWTASAVAPASTPTTELYSAKRKATAPSRNVPRQAIEAQVPAACTTPTSGATIEPVAAVPAATVPAATADVDRLDRHSGLPDGWVCRIHAAPSGQYKRYEGPNGERAQSIKQVWLLHAAGASSESRAASTSLVDSVCWSEIEVASTELVKDHPRPFELVGADVCVMAAAYPTDRLTHSGAVGWRAMITHTRGGASKLQVRVFGSWFRLADATFLKPIKQTT